MGPTRLLPLPVGGGAATEPPQTLLADHSDPCYFPQAVHENEEVVPVNAVSTWVLSSRVTVGR